jgi:hypothetical protein
VLVRAIHLAAEEHVHAARAALRAIPDSEIRNWCVEHGQMSGIFRHRALGRPASSGVAGTGARQPTGAIAAQVLRRDCYHCRYCALAVIPQKVLVAFSQAVGSDVFPLGRTNASRHSTAILFWAQVDHVLPYQQGGTSDPENLVTSCWACNYGKDRFTVGQLGIADPRDRTPIASDWDGLTFRLPKLTAVGRRAFL